MITFEIKIEKGQFGSVLKNAPIEINRIVNEEISEWATRATNIAKSRSPVRTGNLRDSIFPIIEGDKKSVHAEAIYARYVEPPPLGVQLKRKMTRTQFLYNSSMEELERGIQRINQRLNDYFGV